ncbi:cytochrome c oxidase subunit 3 family protein [Bdellovibrio svalbardensis]|uniref:Cytochrome c oxidase subunit 3 family protein n=1 Tax=Bdellovibrio svalbardensis TaxID=2972972 RepID=A0ABT6DMW6_9BACT|nr:cytochrome c oxidase subunit 3 family protein [Bdellovibrio svalbardensis]MDG0817264.1 cytochrome c oxidase subunit 3 family protein [Bdellovibrio svalbardensis]
MSTDNTHGGTHTAHVSHHFKDATQEYDSGKQGIWLFMVTEILMFGAILVGYGIFHVLYPAMFAEGAKELDWKLGFINTLVLIFSSFTMAISIQLIQRNKTKQAAIALATTILCGAIFMVIKYFEWTHKFHLGFYPGRYLDLAKTGAEHANLGMYFGFYFCMTGLHGLHVLIGMGLIAWLLIRTIRGDFHSQYWIPVEGVGIFWHIVDLIWIFLFPLLYLVG